MTEHQTSLPLEAGYHPTPAVPDLRDEIARAWGLPLGERVEIGFRDGAVTAIVGVLELAAAPGYPWNPRQPLQLRVAGFGFSSREIERWTRL